LTRYRTLDLHSVALSRHSYALPSSSSSVSTLLYASPPPLIYGGLSNHEPLTHVSEYRATHSPNPVPHPHDRRTPGRESAQHSSPTLVLRALPDTQRHQVVDQTPAEDPVTRRARQPKAQSRQQLDRPSSRHVLRKRYAAVVQQIQDADASKGLADNVRQHARRAARVHRRLLGKYVVELRQAVDGDKDVCGFEIRAVPAEHPRGDAHVAHGVVGYIVHLTLEFTLLVGLGGVELPEAVEPCQLDELLWKEEPPNEVGLGSC
jgi:hypothetical protein